MRTGHRRNRFRNPNPVSLERSLDATHPVYALRPWPSCSSWGRPWCSSRRPSCPPPTPEGQHQHRFRRRARVPPASGREGRGRIVEYRKEKPFTRPEELMEVKGIGEKLFVTLKPYVTVCGPTTLTAKVRSASSSSRRPPPPRRRRSPPTPSRRARDGDPLRPPGAARPRVSFRCRRHAGRGVDLAVGLLVDRGHGDAGSLAPRGVRRDPLRGSRDDGGLLPRALVRDRAQSQRRTEVPQERDRVTSGRSTRTETATASCRPRSRAASTGRSGVYLPWSRNDVRPGIMTGIRVPDPGQPRALPRPDRRPDPLQQLRHLLLLRDRREHAGIGLSVGRARPDGRGARLRPNGKSADALLPAGRERLDEMIVSIEPRTEDRRRRRRRRAGPREGLSHSRRRRRSRPRPTRQSVSRRVPRPRRRPRRRIGAATRRRPIRARPRTQSEASTRLRLRQRLPRARTREPRIEAAASGRERSAARERFERRAEEIARAAEVGVRTMMQDEAELFPPFVEERLPEVREPERSRRGEFARAAGGRERRRRCRAGALVRGARSP